MGCGTRFDRMKNVDILERFNLQVVVKFVKSRRKAWNEHVSRAEQWLIKLVRDARQKPNDHQDDQQNDGRTVGSRRLQEHPKLYGREEEEEEEEVEEEEEEEGGGGGGGGEGEGEEGGGGKGEGEGGEEEEQEGEMKEKKKQEKEEGEEEEEKEEKKEKNKKEK